jgi:tight adherence protein B
MTQYLAAAAMARSGLAIREIERFLTSRRSQAQVNEPDFGRILIDFAKRTGAPLAELLDSAASYIAQWRQRSDELQTAMATPRASAKIMLLLPLVGLFVTELLGIGSIFALISPAGLLILLLAGLLAWLGQRWAKRILVYPQPSVPLGLLTMLTVAGLQAGLELDVVRFEAWRQLELGADRQLEFEQERIDEQLKISLETGAAASDVLRGLLAQIQAETIETGRRSVQARAVRLMLPLGLTGLPAFMLVSVAPMFLRWVGV